MAVNVDGFVFDLDGTVYLGDAALPGAVEGIAELRRRGKQVLFVSNKPLEPRQAYAAKLTRLGIPTGPTLSSHLPTCSATISPTHEPESPLLRRR